MLALVVSGVVIVAVVLLVAVALFLTAVSVEEREKAMERQARYLAALRRMTSRTGR